MKKKKYSQLLSTLLVVCAALFMIVTNSCTKSTEPSEIVFTALPFACEEFSLGYALGISSDGTTVVGGSAVDTDPTGKVMEEAPVLWVEDQITTLPFPDSFYTPVLSRVTSVYDISNTGVMVGNQGYGDLSPLAYYYSSEQWHAIIDPATSVNAQTATGISGDGNVIVGLSGNFKQDQGGYYFNVATGEFTILESTFGDSAQYSNCQTGLFAISKDGTIMVGSDYAAKYDSIDIEIPIYFDMAKDTSATRLPLTDGYIAGVAEGISADGTTIGGTAIDDDGTPIAVYWDYNLQFHVIGTFSPYPGPIQPPTVALAASDNGDRIVGTSYDIAFIKFKNDEMWSLQDWLEDEGLSSELANWELLTATSITPDGHWIAGMGRNGVYDQAFKVYIP